MPTPKSPRILLPSSWTKQVCSALLHVISLAQYPTAYTRSWASDSVNGRVRLRGRAQGQGAKTIWKSRRPHTNLQRALGELHPFDSCSKDLEKPLKAPPTPRKKIVSIRVRKSARPAAKFYSS
jgi:hypothetical protein